MQLFDFTLTGITTLLIHADIIEADDRIRNWLEQPGNKTNTRAGDDRTPGWKWTGYIHTANDCFVVPCEYIQRCLRTAAAEIPLKGNKTFKSASMSGMAPGEASYNMPILLDGKPIDASDISDIEQETDFDKHLEWVARKGFALDVRRARVGMSKHVRVRPAFAPGWQLKGQMIVWDTKLAKVLPTMFEIAGNQVGIGDWRPSAPSAPGIYGRFEAEIHDAS